MRLFQTSRPFQTPRVLLSLLLLTASAALPAAGGTNGVQFLDVNGTTSVNITFFNGFTNISYNNVAAGDYHMSVNGGPATTAFCTDLFDEVFIPETWTATVHQTSASDGLASASSYYNVAPSNINAIDYIGQNYTTASSSQQAAAQLAIWDLVLGGQVTKSGPSYGWSSKFSESGVQASDVYTIEQVALGTKGAQGSVWLQAVTGSQIPHSYPRPQDFVTAGSPKSPGPSAPEPSSVAAFGFLGLGLAGLLLRARKRSAVPEA